MIEDMTRDLTRVSFRKRWMHPVHMWDPQQRTAALQGKAQSARHQPQEFIS